jgi:hypothetical protein
LDKKGTSTELPELATMTITRSKVENLRVGGKDYGKILNNMLKIKNTLNHRNLMNGPLEYMIILLYFHVMQELTFITNLSCQKN